MNLRPSIAGNHAQVEAELDRFAEDIERMRAGKISDAIWLENRLRFGVYGQRQDGVHMMRSKLPLGLMSAEQLEAFADIIETFGNNNAHLTTRQDIQTHFVTLDSTPGMMKALNDYAMTSREACGNVVRNVTATPLAGVSPTEAFDITPYGEAMAQFLLKHPDAQSLGRKFKVNLAGDDDPRFNLASFHDVGLTARVRDGVRGFALVVGGGLGPVPHEAQLFDDFVAPEEVFPLTQAMLKIFGMYGEKKNRARARMKFLVAKMGIEQFKREVLALRADLAPDPRWTNYLNDEWFALWDDHPSYEPTETELPQGRDRREQQWLRTNIYRQRQAGYAAVKIRVPSGDLNGDQLRALAQLMRKVSGEDTLRIGLDQSLYLRWVPFDKLLELYDGLVDGGLAQGRAGGLGDTVACPGSDTCKLGITSPRSLARSIQATLDRLADDPKLEQLRIHVSGCPNSCAQHQIADIGWFGGARNNKGVTAPHYMLVLGGRAGGVRPPEGKLGAGFGNIVTKVSAHRVSDATELLAQLYLDEGKDGEVFGDFIRRLGFPRIKALLKPLQTMPDAKTAPWFYREPGAKVPFKVVRGVGECAGMPIDLSDFLVSDAEREADVAVQLAEAEGDPETIATHAHTAMLLATRALLASQNVTTEDPTTIEAEFRSRFYDTGRIFEGVGYYFLDSLTENVADVSGDRLRRLVVEAGLFVEEANSMFARMRAQAQVKPVAKRAPAAAQL